MPYDQKSVIASELYDYEKDPLEKESVLDKPEYKQDKTKMEKLFKDCMKRELKGCTEYSKIADFKEPIDTTTNKKGKAKLPPINIE